MYKLFQECFREWSNSCFATAFALEMKRPNLFTGFTVMLIQNLKFVIISVEAITATKSVKGRCLKSVGPYIFPFSSPNRSSQLRKLLSKLIYYERERTGRRTAGAVRDATCECAAG